MRKTAISVIALVLLMSIISPIHSENGEWLEQTQLSFLSQGNEAANMSGCTNISASNYNQNATEDDGSCIHQNMGGYEISESRFEVGIMNGLKFNPNGSKYAILQGDSLVGVPKIIVVATNNNTNVNITEIQLSAFDSPIDFDWSPDGKKFAVMFRNMDVIIFDSQTGNVSDYLFDLNNSSCPSCYNLVSYGEISYNPDGTLISVMTKYSERFYADDLAYGFVINTSTKEIVKLFSREYGPSTGTWSSDGNHFAFQSSYNLTSIIFFDTNSWEATELNIPSNETILSMEYSSDGELIAACSSNRLYVYNTSSLANIWISNISSCWGISWSSNSDYLGVIQSYNYGWWLTWSSGPDGWEWYSDGSSITIYNYETGEIVDRLTTGSGNVCPYCDYIHFFEWHPFSDYIISGGTIYDENFENSFFRKDAWNYNESVEITFGCTEMYSINFNPNATKSDGSCIEFDEHDINRFIADEYATVVDDFYDVFWDFCEWDNSEGEFLCWVEDLSVLSEDMIDELQDCDQSENGCETEPYCENILHGLWGCNYSVPNHWVPPSSDDDQNSFLGMIGDLPEGLVLVLLQLLIVVIIWAGIWIRKFLKRKGSGTLIDNHEDYIRHEEHNSAIPPKGIEIDIRELKGDV